MREGTGGIATAGVQQGSTGRPGGQLLAHAHISNAGLRLPPTRIGKTNAEERGNKRIVETTKQKKFKIGKRNSERELDKDLNKESE